MHHFVVKFSKFSSPQATRGHWLPTKILRTFLETLRLKRDGVNRPWLWGAWLDCICLIAILCSAVVVEPSSRQSLALAQAPIIAADETAIDVDFKVHTFRISFHTIWRQIVPTPWLLDDSNGLTVSSSLVTFKRRRLQTFYSMYDSLHPTKIVILFLRAKHDFFPEISVCIFASCLFHG